MRVLAIFIILAIGAVAFGRDIIPRRDRVWTTSCVAARMIEALKAANRPVPDYLKALGRKASNSGVMLIGFCVMILDHQRSQLSASDQ